MRTKEEILEECKNDNYSSYQLVEALLDIRDILSKDSPEPEKDTKEEEKMKDLEAMGKEDYEPPKTKKL